MLVYILNIISWLEQHQLPCMFKTITHFDCPGCGFQTSFLLLMKGEVYQSFKTYPALLPIILLFAYLILHLINKYKSGSVILKYSYFFCAGLVMLSYIYKIVLLKN